MCAYSKSAEAASRWLVVAVLVSWVATAHAIELLGGDLQGNGFASLTLVHTSDNNFFGQTDDGVGNDFSEVGLNASWRAMHDLQLSGQVLWHRSGGTDDGRARLDYGLLDWTAISGEEGRAGIRLGRVKTAYGLYNKTRDVPFTRPSIVLPQSIYFERTRNLQVAGDGVELYGERYGESGTWSASFAYGRPQADTRAAKEAVVGLNRPGRLETELAPNLHVVWEGYGGAYRLGLTATRVKVRYKPGPGDLLQAGWSQITPIIFSAQYTAENWSLTSELAFRRTEFADFGPRFFNATAEGRSYYLQGTYRLAPKWEALLRYDAYYADWSDRHGSDFAAKTRLPAFSRFARDWTVGLRFDVTPQVMLRAELHAVDGTGFLAAQDNPSPGALHRHWNAFLLQGSYRF